MTSFLTDLQFDSLGVGPLGEHPHHPADNWPAPARPRRPGLTSAASWGELFYCLVGLAPAIAFFVVTITLLSLGFGLLVIYLGIPILVFALLFARATGHLQRILARVMLNLPLAGPRPIRTRRPGWTGLLTGVLTDPGCWRAVAYHCVKIVLAPLMFAVAVGFYAYGLGGLSYALWFRWLPVEQAADGTSHRGVQWAPNLFVDTFWSIAVQCCLALLVLWLAPKVVRLATTMDRVLIAGLLGGPGR